MTNKMCDKINQCDINSKTKMYGDYKSSAIPSVGILNLGCARNTVDSQTILGRLKKNGHEVSDVRTADVAIVNTCSFIREAEEESIDAILDLIELKKSGRIRKIIVTGCLPERHGSQLANELKEIDAIVGVLKIEKEENLPQVSLTPQHYAYVKICESCYNQCSFCMIPKIKGKFSSRTIGSIVDEVKYLDDKGAKEINIIGQDITAYGMDIYQSKSLVRLLKEIIPVTQNIRWIRLLYTFPAHITDELIELMANERKICSYLDVPLQHISNKLLKSMNRNFSKRETIGLITKIRERVPEVSLRTTFIVGFPQETEDDFRELLDFINEVKFERAGAFVYSSEKGAPAYDFSNQIPDQVKRKRLDILMRSQQEISRDIQKGFLGKRIEVLIEKEQEGGENIYLARSEFDAPEVDGLVYVHSQKPLKAGDFVNVNIVDTLEYDLVGELI